MRKFLLFGVLALAALVSCNKGGNDPRLVIITYDGLRWQEVFGGADESLVGNSRFVKDPEALKAAFWRETPQERREVLLPFLWSYGAAHGYLIGNRDKDSRMQVANRMNFSYPGYSEMFCGWPDDERIDSNDPNPNPNVSVLEVANRDPRYKGSVMMYSSWESIRFAVNNDRGGFPGSSGHEPAYVDNAVTALLQDMDGRLVEGFGDSERDDAITAGFALETIKAKHPKVFYVGFGDTDEYAHGGTYDKYLIAAHATDGYIRSIVETCEADPFYKGKTTYILTCDHGRGRGAAFTSHGSTPRGSEETWFIAFGKGVPVLGETTNNGPFYTKQFAATIADILGIDFTPGNGEKCQPFDPSFYEAPVPPTPSAKFAAVDAKPKGQGIRYTYFEGDHMSVAPFLASPAKAKGITPVFTTDVKKREDHFGILFQGLLKIEQDGVYFLTTAGDDGYKVILDGQLIADVDRDGGGTADLYLELAAGYHRIEVQYWENYGGDEIEIGLEGPGINETNLPASMLYYE